MMKQIIRTLAAVVISTASWNLFAESLSCSEGREGEVGYKALTVEAPGSFQEAELPLSVIMIEQKETISGPNGKQTVVNRVEGRVFADHRPLPEPDPATLARLIGTDPTGEPFDYGTFFARPRLSEAESLEIMMIPSGSIRVRCN